MWGLLSLCLGLTGLNLWPRLSVDSAPLTRTRSDITVAVTGAVKAPGTYELAWGASAGDAVRAAGGFRADAEESLVNLADPLDSGEAVFGPTRRTQTGEVRVSLNSATSAELETLPGVGPAIAGRIIDARPYSSVEELLRVKGIGPKTLEKLSPKVKL